LPGMASTSNVQACPNTMRAFIRPPTARPRSIPHDWSLRRMCRSGLSSHRRRR
jgi:hypothetical protein